MTIDLGSGDILVGVVGAGAMGRGIAQVAATGGCRVRLFDTRPGVAAEARDFIASMVDRAAEKGRMSAEDAAAARARLEVVEAVREFAGCNVVIEAVVEDVGVKRKVFAELEDTVSPETLLASNTSSLSVTSIAATCRNPERVAGMHFFNPAPLMRLVEVIAGARTDPAVTDALVALAERMGKVAVRVADAPGFLVNQVGRGYTIESAHIVSEGVASTFDIDRILRDGVGFRMGPFELMDLTALDVTHPATEAIYRQFYDEPRYRPSLLIALRHEAGLLGRKTKRGFYDYTSGSQVGPAEQPPAPYDGRPVWIDDSEPDLSRHLRDIVVDAGGTLESGAAPSGNALILVTPVGGDATTACAERGLDARRTVAVDMLFGVDRRRTLMRTPLTTVDASAAARGLLGGGDVPATVINDSPGFVAQRVIASIVNIGSAVAQARTATPGDIDTAVTLALNYPNGPLGFGDAAGPATVLRILETIQRLTGDPRYRPSPWLRRRAQLGVSLLTPEE